jgi:hypothetical protein
MTLALNRNPAFAAIRSLSGPSPLWALAGASRKVLVAEKQGEQLVFTGESEDLGAEVLGVNTETFPNCHVLTAKGLTRVSNDSSPQIISETAFDPGGGNWLHMFGGIWLATPLARGGVQVVAAETAAQVSVVHGLPVRGLRRFLRHSLGSGCGERAHRDLPGQRCHRRAHLRWASRGAKLP